MYKINRSINPSIFRGYDIRGVINKDINEDVYYTIGRAYATFLRRRRVAYATIGRDNRRKGEEFSKAFIKGLNDGGVNTIDLGLSLSQIVYFSSYEFKTKGSAMITASHNPKNYNGLKLGTGYSETMITEEILELKHIVFNDEFCIGHGKNICSDIYPIYKKEIRKYFQIEKQWRIVVDGCNTISGYFYPNLFKDFGIEVIEQNCTPDSDFPLGDPDPTEFKVLNRLSEGVKNHKADIGFAYDADGDRMAVVDENGSVLWMDTIVSIFAQDVLEYLPGAPIVYNTLCSKQVTDTIENAGGKPIMWLTGHSFIKAKIKETRAPFGGELSGHIFFTDNFYGHDDGAYASLRLLQYLERKNINLSQAVKQLTRYISSPEIKLGLADELKFEYIDTKIAPQITKIWPNADVIDIDGIRIDSEDEMVIIRASHNGPYITIKFESKTIEQYDKLRRNIRDVLKGFDEIDWTVGVNTNVLDD